jgi:hypothetical protein
MNVLVMLPTEKRVSIVTGVEDDATAVPDTPVHISPSGNITAAETPGNLPLLRMPLRAVCRALAVAASRWAAYATGAASCEVGTGTIEMFGVAVAAGARGDGVADGAAAPVPVGDGVVVALPHATTTATSNIPAAARRAGT